MAISSIPTLINGQAYDYSNIILRIMNVPMVSATSINYTETEEKANNYGLGKFPVSIGGATREMDGSLELAMNDVEALRTVAIDGRLLNLPPFDTQATFGNSGNVPVTDIIKNVRFKDDGVETTVGDTTIRRTFAITFTQIISKR